MDTMTHVWVNFIGSYGVQYLMAAIVFVSAFFLKPTAVKDKEQEEDK